MTLRAFQLLNKAGQMDKVKEAGVFLVHRQEVGVDIVLYQVHNFYVEFYFCSDKSGSITHLESFDEGSLPAYYLTNIDITAINDILKP
jgi:hypothetical protein